MVTLETKVCKCCGRELPVTNFRVGKYGERVGICYDCVNIHREEKKEARRRMKAEEIKREQEDRQQMGLAQYTNVQLFKELARRGITGSLTLTKDINLTDFA